MRILLVSLFVAFILFSCGENIPHDKATPVFTEVHRKGPETRRTLKLEIEGMMCEVGCASKIKKELLEQDAVSSVIIDFDKERETDYAIVEYDPKANTEFNIYSSVNMIADGQLYDVIKVETTYYKDDILN